MSRNRHEPYFFFFFFQAVDGIRYRTVTGVQTCALPILAAVALHDQAGDRLRHSPGPGHDVLRPGIVVPGSSGAGDQAGTGDREGGRGDQAGQAPDPAGREPAPRAGYRAHGRSTVSRVGPPGGLAISSVPSTDSARRDRPARPVPRAGPAPPTPSSRS